MGTDGRKRPSGLVTGSLIAISFGTVFVMVNSGELPGPWPWVIRALGALIAVGLVLALLRTVRGGGSQPAPAGGQGFADRRYHLIVVAEVVALFGGLAVINQVLDVPEVSVAWIAVVVGVHFFGLAWAWRMPFYHWLGAVLTTLGLAGFLVHAMGGSAGLVGLVAGVGSGVALYAAVVLALRDARRAAAA